MPAPHSPAFSTGLRTYPAIVKLLTLQQFFEGFVPIMALYAIMFERVGGLSFSQIGVLFSIWSISYVVAELPSGVLADYWSRRNVIIIAGLLRAVGLGIWLLWPGTAGYAVGFALWGLMMGCTSGSVAAYLHNELKVVGEGAKYAKYYGWITSAYWLGTLSGFLIAAILTLGHADFLIGLGVFSSLLFSIVLLLHKESPYAKKDTYIKTMLSGLDEIKKSKQLRYLCLVLFSVYMIIGVLEELLPRLYAAFGLSDSMVSVALAVSLLLTVFLIARLESYVHFSILKQVLLMAVGTGLLLIGLLLGGFAGVVLIVLFSLLFQLFRPLFQHHVQEAVQGDERATVGSIPGLAAGLLGAGAYAVISAIAEHSSELWSIAIYGGLWTISLLALAYYGKSYTTPPLS